LLERKCFKTLLLFKGVLKHFFCASLYLGAFLATAIPFFTAFSAALPHSAFAGKKMNRITNAQVCDARDDK
jgi:hypothetical protein